MMDIDQLAVNITNEGYQFAIDDSESNTNIHHLLSETPVSEIDASLRLTTQVLRQLVDEEIAFSQDHYVVVPHTTIAELPFEELHSLSLPEYYPFEVEIRSSGTLADRDFKYIYHFLNGNEQPFVNIKRTGTYTEITSMQTYLITGSLYYLLEKIDAFNKQPQETKSGKDNLIQFAQIRKLSQSVGAVLDAYLNQEQVVIPDKLGVRLKKTDDDIIEVEPVLCQTITTEDEEVAYESTLNEDEEKGFIDCFDRFSRERDLYSIPDGPRVVLDEPQKKALKQFKQVRRVLGEEKAKLLESPQTFFDPDVVDLDSFSDRVKEIGEYQPRVFPFLHPQKEAWLPPEGGIVIDGTLVYVKEEEASALKEEIGQAIEKKQATISWKGQDIPATSQTLKAIDSFINSQESGATGRTDTDDQNDQDEIGKSKVLIIKDNFEEQDFSAESDVRPGRDRNRVPKHLQENVELLSHQIEGLAWLQNLWISGANGALLADDMGLGKTLQALSFLSWQRELVDNGLWPNKPVLIVAPVALIQNWKEEYDKFIDPPVLGPFLELHGSHVAQFRNEGISAVSLDHKEISKASVVITTYETLRNYQVSLGQIDWGIIVVDEVQKMKTPSAMITMAVKAMKYDFGLSMTGTPVENSWVDLWSIMDFVQPGQLGSLKEFSVDFQNPLSKPDTDREALGQRLRDKVSSLLLRRLKADHLDGLPKKKVIVYEEQMPPVQLDRYLGVVQQANQTIDESSSEKKKTHILSLIAALRDVSLCPHLPYYTDHGFQQLSTEEIINSSARVRKTVEILKEIKARSEKAIIFLISRKMQRIMQQIISEQFKIYAHIINGEVKGGRRKDLIDAFQGTSGFNVIIMSTEAAGVGLNVTAANHVIHLSRAWNPAKEDQATDRVYRIGQEHDVVVHIPLSVHSTFDNEMSRGSFDQKLNRLLTFKRELSRSVLMPTAVSQDEWRDIAQEILNSQPVAEEGIHIDDEALDNINPNVFEEVVAELYRQQGYQVIRTPASKDYGADVVVLPHGEGNRESFLIQCKHTINPEKSLSGGGIQEIVAARGIYEKKYELNFELIVATNSLNFTPQAQEIAKANGVNLISRSILLELLRKFPIQYSTIGLF